MLDCITFDVLIPSSRTLFDTSFYGDGVPTWTEGKSKKRAQTTAEAFSERQKLVKVLRRHCKGDEAARELADLIAGCREGHRCLSGACPECSRAGQRLFVAYGQKFIKRGGARWVVASIVWRDLRFAQGELDASSMFESLKERLTVTLRRTKIHLAFGGFDISMNEHKRGRFAPHWRPHAWILVATRNPEKLKKILKASFRPSKRVMRPVRVIRYDHSPAGLAYALKNRFSRRVSLPPKKRVGLKRIRRNTRNRHLRASQKVELALALHKVGLAGRVFEFDEGDRT